MQQNPTPQLPSHLAVPQTAPPYDDEHDQIQDRNGNVPRSLSAAPPLAADRLALPASLPAVAAGPWQLSDSCADGWPDRFAQVLAETLAGTRPARQLTPWTTERARKRIAELGPMLATARRPRVHRVLTSAPRREVLEVAAVVDFGSRVRALAVRLELAKAPPHRPGPDRWRCTHIETA